MFGNLPMGFWHPFFLAKLEAFISLAFFSPALFISHKLYTTAISVPYQATSAKTERAPPPSCITWQTISTTLTLTGFCIIQHENFAFQSAADTHQRWKYERYVQNFHPLFIVITHITGTSPLPSGLAYVVCFAFLASLLFFNVSKN